MNVQILVRTADKVPIVGATVALGSGTPIATDQNGTATLAPTDNSFTLTAALTNYSEQSVTVTVNSDGSIAWDDPGTIVTGSSQQMNVEIRLGRLVPAPTVAMSSRTLDDNVLKIPDSTFKQIAGKFKPPRDPSYVVPLQNTFTVDDGEYAFLYAGNKRFWAATGPTILGDPNAKGWGAFAATANAIEPRVQGKFLWVEWGPPGGSPSSLNRYLVGLWRPRSSVVSGSVPRDVILYYTPNTLASEFYLSDTPPYRKNYPYALNQRNHTSDPALLQLLTQRYVTLGTRYLFDEYFLAYQLLAAACDALVIVPIQPAEQWGNLQTPAGVQRLLSEAVLFDHRQRLTPDADSKAVDTAPARNQSGGLITRTRSAQYLPPPGLGTVVSAGNSAGMGAIAALTNLSVRSQQNTRSWQDESQDPYSADPTEFIASWRELWDLDGSANVVGSFGQWVGQMANWQRASGHYTSGSSDRVVRSFHTDYTGWSASNLPDTRPFVGNPVPNGGGSPQSGRAAQLYGTSGSAVWFSRTYLTGNGPPDGWNSDGDPPDTPAFWVDVARDAGKSAHRAVTMICFAHAAALSKLRKLS